VSVDEGLGVSHCTEFAPNYQRISEFPLHLVWPRSVQFRAVAPALPTQDRKRARCLLQSARVVNEEQSALVRMREPSSDRESDSTSNITLTTCRFPQMTGLSRCPRASPDKHLRVVLPLSARRAAQLTEYAAILGKPLSPLRHSAFDLNSRIDRQFGI
jgi:hypothetical protein